MRCEKEETQADVWQRACCSSCCSNTGKVGCLAPVCKSAWRALWDAGSGIMLATGGDDARC